eukprot:4941300-Heterocapsa_arctica.AAC.1
MLGRAGVRQIAASFVSPRVWALRQSGRRACGDQGFALRWRLQRRSAVRSDNLGVGWPRHTHA